LLKLSQLLEQVELREERGGLGLQGILLTEQRRRLLGCECV
jgi:hypothetical protein